MFHRHTRREMSCRGAALERDEAAVIWSNETESSDDDTDIFRGFYHENRDIHLPVQVDAQMPMEVTGDVVDKHQGMDCHVICNVTDCIIAKHQKKGRPFCCPVTPAKKLWNTASASETKTKRESHSR